MIMLKYIMWRILKQEFWEYTPIRHTEFLKMHNRMPLRKYTTTAVWLWFFLEYTPICLQEFWEYTSVFLLSNYRVHSSVFLLLKFRLNLSMPFRYSRKHLCMPLRNLRVHLCMPLRNLRVNLLKEIWKYMYVSMALRILKVQPNMFYRNFKNAPRMPLRILRVTSFMIFESICASVWL